MKIVLFSESPIIFYKGNYYAKDTWIYFPLYFSTLCELFTIICTTKKVNEVNFKEFSKLNLQSAKIIFISDYATFLEYYKNLLLNKIIWIKIIDEQIEKHNIVWIRTPSPIMQLIFKSKYISSKKIVCFLAGDIKKQSDRLIRAKGIISILYRLFVNYYIKNEIYNYNNADILYYYSDELKSRFHMISTNKIAFRTPVISNSDICNNVKLLDKKNIKLIRVCWLLQSKGLEYLIDAVEILRGKYYNVNLSIIGAASDPEYTKELYKYIYNKKLDDNVKILGWKSSKEIGEYFKNHDIHVLSSLSEGTPRVILESLCKSIPLVTTNVGGISTMLTDKIDCLMVDPYSSSQLAEAIEKIINNHKLRSFIIKNGFNNSTKWTIENKSKEIFKDMSKLFNEIKN